MSHGRLLIPLLLLTTAAGRAACQPPAAPPSDPCGPSLCAPVCAPAPRVRVIVPPPEVVFCSPAKRCGRLFHHEQPCPAPCAPPAPCAAVPPVVAPAMTSPAGGMVSFNMNMAVPYMTYQMTPVMMGSVGFSSMGMMGGTFGMPMGGMPMAGMGMMGGTLGMPMAAPVGGINLGLGLGGGMQMNLGSNVLAAALGLGTSGTSAADMQLLRALLGRAAGNGTDATRPAGTADNSPEAQMRALNTRISDITTQISNELANVRQMRSDINQNMQLLPMLAQQIKKLEGRIEEVEKKTKTGSE